MHLNDPIVNNNFFVINYTCTHQFGCAETYMHMFAYNTEHKLYLFIYICILAYICVFVDLFTQ